MNRLPPLHWLSIALGATCTLASSAMAGEGMWLPEQLESRAEDLRAQGLELEASALANLDAAPLNAIISLGGCSASFVSPEGLVITNHHCAVGGLQLNSTPENNVLEDGVYAHNREDEPWAGPGSRVYVTRSMQDVTAQISEAAAGAGDDDAARYLAVEDAQKALVATCEETEGVRCAVAAFDGGARYRLIEQLEIQDVRIVYAPPHMVGFYGGDEDNWMWPRHTGDFTFFRAYVGPDGAPAEYSEDNVPYEPESWLQVADEVVDEGDFVMVAGYPGRTYRHRTGYEMQWARDVTYPWNVDTMGSVLEILDRHIEADEEAAVALSSMRFGISNYHKNNQGMLDGFEASGAVDRAMQRDDGLRLWLALQSEPGGEPGPAWEEDIDELAQLLEDQRATSRRDRLLGWAAWNASLVGLANSAVWNAYEQQKPDAQRESGYQERDQARLRERVARIDRTLHVPAEVEVFTYYLNRIAELPEPYQVLAWQDEIVTGSMLGNGYYGLVSNIYEESELTESDVRAGLYDMSVAELEAMDDPIVNMALKLYSLRRAVRDRDDALEGAALRLRPSYLAAMEAFTGEETYPDANSTLRVTYGMVQGYSPRDGMHYTPLTTVQGVVAKDTGVEPFDAPDDLVEHINAGEWGEYAHPRLQTVAVNFLSTLDTTGGNSGSATLNSRGELCGLLFDGNYESMASDWLFDPVATRSIHVSMGYVLWMAEHVHEMTELLEELERAER